MGEVEEERFVAGPPDEGDGLFGVALGEGGLFGKLGIGFEAAVVAEGSFGLHPGRDHVVAVEQAEVGVESLPGGHVAVFGAQVPFAHHGGAVALRLERFGERDLLRRQAGLAVGTEHVAHPRADGVAAREEGCAGGGAGRGGRVELGEAHAFGGHLVEVRRANRRVAVARQVAVAEIVGEEDDEVGAAGRFSGAGHPGRGGAGSDEDQRHQKEEAAQGSGRPWHQHRGVEAAQGAATAWASQTSVQPSSNGPPSNCARTVSR